MCGGHKHIDDVIEGSLETSQLGRVERERERDAIERQKENRGEGDEAPHGIIWYREKERNGRRYWWGNKASD